VASDDDLRVLWWLINNTEGAAAQLYLAAHAAREGRHQEAQVHAAICADAIAIVHPGIVSDPVLLAKVLQRFFLTA